MNVKLPWAFVPMVTVGALQDKRKPNAFSFLYEH